MLCDLRHLCDPSGRSVGEAASVRGAALEGPLHGRDEFLADRLDLHERAREISEPCGHRGFVQRGCSPQATPENMPASYRAPRVRGHLTRLQRARCPGVT